MSQSQAELDLIIATEHDALGKHIAALGPGVISSYKPLHAATAAHHAALGSALLARYALEYPSPPATQPPGSVTPPTTTPGVPTTGTPGTGTGGQRPPPKPPPGPKDYGCPDDMEETLIAWAWDPVDGAGRPTKDGSHYDMIAQCASGKTMERFNFNGRGDELDKDGKGIQTEMGIASGSYKPLRNLRVKNAVVRKVRKWGGRAHLLEAGNVIENVTFQDGYDEHDIYGEPVANGLTKEQNEAIYKALLDGTFATLPDGMAGVCMLVDNVLSQNSASQVQQWCQRERDGLTPAQMGECGTIWIRGGMAINHASETSGKGTRRSHALKFFSAQLGPDENHNTWRNMNVHVLVEDWTLDDSMQELSNGAILFGRNRGGTIRRCSFRLGNLIQEAIRVELDSDFAAPYTATQMQPCGPLIFDDIEIFAKSGENGRGIHVFDLKRPFEVKPNCGGNLRIYGPKGETLSHITEGYKQGF